MSCQRRWPLATMLLAVLVAGPTGAVAPFAVALQAPDAGTPVFGLVEVEATIDGLAPENVASVTLSLDGRAVGRLESPPFRWQVDVGEENRAHLFVVDVVAKDGRGARATVETPAFRIDEVIDIPLQQLYVTVTDGDRPVLDLVRDDFRVWDDGLRQELVTFERGDVPMSAMILLDASASMRGDRLEAARAGARRFVDGMRDLDQAQIVLFADRPLRATPVSGFGDVLKAGLGRVHARGGTALNDQLYRSLAALEHRQGRRVIVLLSDGLDVTSVLDMAQVLPAVRASSAMIFWLRLGLPDRRAQVFSAWRSAEDHRRELRDLERAVAASGGRTITLATIDETERAFAAVLAELRDQYVLGFYPSVDRDDGSWHPLRVGLRSGNGLRVRTRAGYVDR